MIYSSLISVIVKLMSLGSLFERIFRIFLVKRLFVMNDTME